MRNLVLKSAITSVILSLWACNEPQQEQDGGITIDYDAQAKADSILLSQNQSPQPDEWAQYYEDYIQLSNGLSYKLIQPGNGAVVQEGDHLFLEIVARHSHKIIFKDNASFDFQFRDVMDQNSYFKGWEKALIGKKEGAYLSVYIPHYLVDYKQIGAPYGKSVEVKVKIKKIVPFHQLWDLKNKSKVTVGKGVYFKIKSKSGLKVKARRGDKVYVRYAVFNAQDQSLIESNFRSLYLPETQIGKFGVIEGWNMALPQINIGDSVQIFVPSAMAYRGVGKPGIIAPDTDLIFDLVIEKKK